MQVAKPVPGVLSMKILLCVLAVAAVLAVPMMARAVPPEADAPAGGGSVDQAAQPAAIDVPFDTPTGEKATLRKYHGQVILVVNTASRCGYTRQYAGLEALYKSHKDRGLIVVAFPSNDFGGQEPGSNDEIQEFCSSKFGITFPVMGKMPVKGEERSPLYAALTGSDAPFPGDPKWNFEKFLIGRDGTILARFPSKVEPDSPEVLEALEKALSAGTAPGEAPGK
jgi:glutathione peroxidase